MADALKITLFLINYFNWRFLFVIHETGFLPYFKRPFTSAIQF